MISLDIKLIALCPSCNMAQMHETEGLEAMPKTHFIEPNGRTSRIGALPHAALSPRTYVMIGSSPG
jgi:hypothetical protein